MTVTRKTVFLREVIESDSYGEACEPVTPVAIAAVFRNPLAGRFERDLSPLFEIGAELGERQAKEAGWWVGTQPAGLASEPKE